MLWIRQRLSELSKAHNRNIVAVCEKVVQTRVSYVPADSIQEALNKWHEGEETDWDYAEDQHQLGDDVSIFDKNGDEKHVKVYRYKDEEPEKGISYTEILDKEGPDIVEL